LYNRDDSPHLIRVVVVPKRSNASAIFALKRTYSLRFDIFTAYFSLFRRWIAAVFCRKSNAWHFGQGIDSSFWVGFSGQVVVFDWGTIKINVQETSRQFESDIGGGLVDGE
jgi:hypothetical protein